jgi:hypothetical protein
MVDDVGVFPTQLSVLLGTAAPVVVVKAEFKYGCGGNSGMTHGLGHSEAADDTFTEGNVCGDGFIVVERELAMLRNGNTRESIVLLLASGWTGEMLACVAIPKVIIVDMVEACHGFAAALHS